MSTSPSQTLNSLACQTLAAVKEALQTKEAASVVQVIQLIREIADKGDSMPVQQLAEIIARDLTTMSKVLRAANTLGYNPEGAEVTTITQAIHVIGFEKVRNLAISLLLVENAEGKVLAEESRDVAGLAVASGLVAQSLIEQKGVLDPEQSFVCAALRNYGKLLLTTFFLEDYRRARQLPGVPDADTAFRKVFGLTPLELGYEVLHSAQFPRRILACLQIVPPERISAPRPLADEQMVVLAEFSVKLCELIQELGASPATFETASAALLAKYGRVLTIHSQDLALVLKAVQRKLTAFGTVHNLRGFTSPLMKNIGVLASQGEKPGEAPGAGAPLRTDKTVSETQARDILLAGGAEVAQLMAMQPVDFEKILDATRRCLQSALKLTHCVVFLKDPGGTRFSVRVGSSPLLEQLRGRPLLDPRHDDVFQLALTRGDDVMIQNPNDPKVSPLIPEWLRGVSRNKTLIVLPIREDDGTFALILGVSELLSTLELAVQLKQQLKFLRGHVAFVRGMQA